MSKTRDKIFGLIEVVLVVAAFGLLIPEVPSQGGHVCHLFPGLLFATLLFALPQHASSYRDRQSWWVSIAKTLLFVAFGWLMFQRVQMGPMT